MMIKSTTPVDAGVLSALMAPITRQAATCLSLCAIKKGEVIIDVAVGHKVYWQVPPGREEKQQQLNAPIVARHDDIYDIASITKVMATLPLVLREIQQGTWSFATCVKELLPQTHDTPLGKACLMDLLCHTAGLKNWRPLYVQATSSDAALKLIAETPLSSAAGHARVYSDLGFIVLGAALERAYNTSLAELFLRHIASPLKLSDSGFAPKDTERLVPSSWGDCFERRMLADKTFALCYAGWEKPTDFLQWRRHSLVGEVQDGNSHHVFRGIAGHAGLFATALDVASFGHALCLDTNAFASPLCTIDFALRQRTMVPQRPGSLIGWEDLKSLSSTHLPSDVTGVMHRGFSGTVLAVLPDEQLSVAILSNRCHANGSGDYTYMGPFFADIIKVLRLVI